MIFKMADRCEDPWNTLHNTLRFYHVTNLIFVFRDQIWLPDGYYIWCQENQNQVCHVTKYSTIYGVYK